MPRRNNPRKITGTPLGSAAICTSKRRYSSKQKADHAIKRVYDEYDTETTSYQCLHCLSWHLTRSKHSTSTK